MVPANSVNEAYMMSQILWLLKKHTYLKKQAKSSIELTDSKCTFDKQNNKFEVATDHSLTHSYFVVVSQYIFNTQNFLFQMAYENSLSP